MPKKFVPLEQKLTPIEERFVESYIGNGYRADLAYLSIKPGTPPEKVKGNAYHWRQALNAHIEQRRQEVYDELHIDAMRTITEIADIAYAAKDDETYITPYKLKALDMLAKSQHLYEKEEKPEEDKVIHVTIEE